MMSDRRAELERKKAKLQALREEKDRRRREKELKDVEEAANRVLLGTDGDRKELDEMLSSLGVAPVSDVLSSISSANSLTPEQSRNHTPDTSLQHNSLPNKYVLISYSFRVFFFVYWMTQIIHSWFLLPFNVSCLARRHRFLLFLVQ